MMNINNVLDPTTGNLLELPKLLRTPEAKIWRYVAFNELAHLSQGSKKQTIIVTKTTYFISPSQKPINKKVTYA